MYEVRLSNYRDIVPHSANTSEIRATKKPHNYHKIAVWQKDDRIRKSPLKFFAYYYSELEGDCQASIITQGKITTTTKNPFDSFCFRWYIIFSGCAALLARRVAGGVPCVGSTFFIPQIIEKGYVWQKYFSLMNNN